MSVRSMAKVWADSAQAGTGLLMLLAIADFADDAGNAYPAVGTLADKCRMTARNANRLLADLRDSGELEIRLNEGPRGANRYRLVFDRMTRTSSPLTPASPCQPRPGPLTSTSSPPDVRFPKPLTPASDEPSLNHQGTIKEPVEARERAKAERQAARTAWHSHFPGVSRQVLDDYAAVRRAKRAGDVTLTVARGFVDEARKANVTLEEALVVCCQQGWQAFKAEWFANLKRGRGGEPKARAGTRSFAGVDYTQGLP